MLEHWTVRKDRDRRADCYQYENMHIHTLLYVLYKINLLNISLPYSITVDYSVSFYNNV